MSELLIETEGHVRVLTINRPDRMNSLTPDLTRSITEAFVEANNDRDVRAVILTAVGDRAFCAGADLSLAGRRTRPASPIAISCRK